MNEEYNYIEGVSLCIICRRKLILPITKSRSKPITAKNVVNSPVHVQYMEVLRIKLNINRQLTILKLDNDIQKNFNHIS